MPKITITGPESTGKSKLASLLSKHLGASLVREYAREYLTGLNRPYDETDLQKMAFHQHKLEIEAHKHNEYVVCDTDLLTFVIWWEVKYGYCPDLIENLWYKNLPDLYLLCDIDLPWEDDDLREHPHRRKELMELYKERLTRYQTPFKIVSGQKDHRLKNALAQLEQAQI